MNMCTKCLFQPNQGLIRLNQVIYMNQYFLESRHPMVGEKYVSVQAISDNFVSTLETSTLENCPKKQCWKFSTSIQHWNLKNKSCDILRQDLKINGIVDYFNVVFFNAHFFNFSNAQNQRYFFQLSKPTLMFPTLKTNATFPTLVC